MIYIYLQIQNITDANIKLDGHNGHTKHSAADLPIHIHRSHWYSARLVTVDACDHSHPQVDHLRHTYVYTYILIVQRTQWLLHCKHISCVCVDLQIYICIGILAYICWYFISGICICKHILTFVLDQLVYIREKRQEHLKKNQAGFASFRWRCYLKQTHWSYMIWYMSTLFIPI